MKKFIAIVLFVLPVMCLAQRSTTMTLTIPPHDSLSNVVDIKGFVPVALIMPSAWNTAQISFKTGTSTATLYNYYGMDGNAVVIKPHKDKAAQITQQTAQSFARYLQIKSCTDTTNVAQDTTRVIKLILKAL